MLTSIYTKIPGYDITLCDRAAPDYGLLVNSTFPCPPAHLEPLLLAFLANHVPEFFYGYIFSFPGILDSIESAACIVAALLSIDCQEQVRNHMLGMQYFGASRDEVGAVRAVVVTIAEHLGVKGKKGRTAIEVPYLPAPVEA